MWNFPILTLLDHILQRSDHWQPNGKRPVMSRLPLLDFDTAVGSARALLGEVQQRFGATPNMTRVMANSPALLKGYLGLSTALATGNLPPLVRELVALYVSDRNACEYCLSAHTFVAGQILRLDDDGVRAARRGESSDPMASAALRLAMMVDQGRGRPSEEDLARARAAGLTNEQIGEIIGHVALTVLTNSFNKAMAVDIDFPVVTVEQP
jgi:uncharacterized peroxidase-related enzyme